jgi:hypothetical protein
MLLGRPWLQDVKVSHDWGKNLVTIQCSGIVLIITMTQHLGNDIKRLEVLVCYNFQHGIIDDEKDVVFIVEPKLFSIGTIVLSEEAKILDESMIECTKFGHIC